MFWEVRNEPPPPWPTSPIWTGKHRCSRLDSFSIGRSAISAPLIALCGGNMYNKFLSNTAHLDCTEMLQKRRRFSGLRRTEYWRRWCNIRIVYLLSKLVPIIPWNCSFNRYIPNFKPFFNCLIYECMYIFFCRFFNGRFLGSCNDFFFGMKMCRINFRH